MASLTKGWPATPTPLIGREAEVESVRSLLRQPATRLVTLVGPAGVGKTRLAIEATAGLTANFEDGVYFVDLSVIEDPDRVLDAIAAAVGVREGPAEPLAEQLPGYLASRRVLLLLDNFEQIVTAGLGVGQLLAACPALTVLVTSRVPLELSWERRFPVSGLVLPGRDEASPEALAESPAIALFVERARAVLPNFDVDPQNARVLAEICTRLDGLPLPIELAAAQIDVLPPVMILEGLRDSGLDILAGGSRDQPRRHQTLRAAIAWSEHLLDSKERDAFFGLAVFAGGCTLQAAATVCNAPEAGISKLLGSLVRKNLLRFDAAGGPGGRYRMLEMVREYALEQLRASGHEAEARDLHLRWCMSEAEEAEIELSGFGQVQWLGRLDDELDNLRAAMSWCQRPGGSSDSGAQIAVDLDRFWEVRHITEGSRWLELWVERLGAGQRLLRAQVLAALGILAIAQSKITEAAAHLEECLDIAKAAGHERLEVKALTRMSLAVAFLGNRERARQLLEQGLAMSEEIGDLYGKRYATYHLGNTISVSSPEEALPWFIEAQTLCRQAGDVDLLRWALGNEGRTHEMLGDYERAGALFREALRLSLELQSPWGIVTYFYRLAGLAGLRQEYERAAQLHGVAEVQRQRYGIGYGFNGREPDLPSVRAALGNPSFYDYQAEGRAMRFDEAVAYAISSNNRPSRAPLRLSGPLSRRQSEVLRLIAAGKTNREIAAELVLSERTVQRHIADIYLKINVRNRSEATAYALSRL